jgi:diguanylate cyclase (GGDEF)-like protein
MGTEDTTNPQKTVVTTVQEVARKASTPGSSCLVIIYGEDIGRRIPLGSEPLVIGRSAKCDVVIEQESVSRNHARIAHDGRGYVVQDLGSTNGTYVNDVLIDRSSLRDGDQIKVGRTIFKFLSGGNVESQYHEEIYRLMTVDGLTEVHNKRYFHEQLEREASRCRRYARTFSLVVFDIDHFKQVNDTYGHLAGDAVLRQLAQTVRTNIRRDDTLGRIGGEEFGLILPEVGLEGARALAEKLRTTVEKTEFRFEGQIIPVTVSLGVACWSPGLDDGQALVRAADMALYDAKRGGRNRVCG